MTIVGACSGLLLVFFVDWIVPTSTSAHRVFMSLMHVGIIEQMIIVMTGARIAISLDGVKSAIATLNRYFCSFVSHPDWGKVVVRTR